jgi:hypothetical protein
MRREIQGRMAIASTNEGTSALERADAEGLRLFYGRLRRTGGLKSHLIEAAFFQFRSTNQCDLRAEFESNRQPTPQGTLPSLNGTRRIESRRSFEGHDVQRT